MQFEYRLTGKGWAAARIADNASHAVLIASYLSDALGDLLEAVSLLLEGASEAWCTWQEEPGEHRWIFVRTGDNDVQLSILAFDDTYCPEPDERGELCFCTTQPLAVIDRWQYAAGAGNNRPWILGDSGAAIVLSRRRGFAEAALAIRVLGNSKSQ